MDVVDRATRSRMMSGIRGKNTIPELRVRSFLHRSGLRFRLHKTGMPGRPDLVLKKHNAVVFVHGCFWHRHPGCRFSTTPGTNKRFWKEKFDANRDRDKRNTRALRKVGWRVFVIWECQTSRLRCLAKLRDEIRQGTCSRPSSRPSRSARTK